MQDDHSTPKGQRPPNPQARAIRLLKETGTQIDPETVPDPEVLQRCRCKTRKDGTQAPIKTARNLALILAHDHRWKGKVKYNKFTATTTINGEPVTDLSDLKAQNWIEKVYGICPSTQAVSAALQLVGSRSPYHPVADWLDSLSWDGTERISQLLPAYYGSERTDLNRTFSRKFMISIVARVRKQGSKLDQVLCLSGRQGLGKSTGLRALVGEQYFSDTMLDFRNTKDVYQMIGGGVLLYEISELHSFRSGELQQIKAFITSTHDRYRPSYGRYIQSYPRGLVFTATTNSEQWLVDPTGNRRFWCVRLVQDHVDVKGIERDRAQLFAEADQAYKAGESWWLDQRADIEAHSQANEAHMRSEPWEGVCEEWLSRKAPNALVRIDEMLKDALLIDPGKQTRQNADRARAVLEALGWTRSRKRIKGRNVRVFKRPPEE